MVSNITSTLKLVVKENGHHEPFLKDHRDGYASSVNSTYAVQHLKSFTVKPDREPLHTSEAVELLNKQKRFYIRKYDLKLAEKSGSVYMVLVDPWHGYREVERFPIRYLRAPRYHMTSSDKCQYNNLFLFTIEAHSLPDGSPSSHEVHIFQVLSCTAKQLVDELIQAGMPPHVSNPPISSSSVELVPMIPIENTRVQWENRFQLQRIRTPDSGISNSSTGSEKNLSPVVHMAASGRAGQKELVAKTINSDWVDAEGTLLNHCFDDVEERMMQIRTRFQRMIYKSNLRTSLIATSTKRTARKLTKRSQAVEQQVLDDEFCETAEDFFRKVKFSLILLSRLTDHVDDPKAPVLVKQLFQLLSECVTYWRQSSTLSAEFPRTIRQPLFPRYTIVYLEANLIGEHENLLRELGPAWNTAREDIDPQPVFVPQFIDGFRIIKDEYEPTLFNYDKPGVDHNPEHRYLQTTQLNAFAKTLFVNDRKVAKAIVDYYAVTMDNVNLRNGEYVEVLEDLGDVQKIRTHSGAVGLCPLSTIAPVTLD